MCHSLLPSYYQSILSKYILHHMLAHTHIILSLLPQQSHHRLGAYVSDSVILSSTPILSPQPKANPSKYQPYNVANNKNYKVIWHLFYHHTISPIIRRMRLTCLKTYVCSRLIALAMSRYSLSLYSIFAITASSPTIPYSSNT